MLSAWMLYTLLVGALVLVAAIATERLLRLAGRPGRTVWVVAIAAALLLPVLTMLRTEAPPATDSAATGAPIVAPAPSIRAMVPAMPAAPSLDRPLLLAWGATSFLLLAGLLRGAGRLALRRRGWRAETVDGRPVLLAHDIGPAVVGWRRMEVVLPFWALGWDAEARRLILAHEEEHIRRGDPRLLLGGLLAALLVPWNLALWYANRRLRLAIELDCDARVLAAGADARRYGEVLLAAGARAPGGRLPALATFAERATQLERRLTALGGERSPARRRLVGAGVVALTAVLAACTLDNPLGLDLTNPDQRITLHERTTNAGPDWPRIKQLASTMVEAEYPGAAEQGGVPEEVIVALVLDERERVMAQSIVPVAAADLAPSALAEIEKERIKSIDVLKGRPLGLENVGVIVVRLRAPGESRETAQLHQVETPVTSPSGVIQADRQPLLRDKVPAAGEVVEIPVKVLLRERVPAAGTVVETPARVLLRERVPLTKEGAGAAGGQLREIPVTSLPRRVPPQ